MKYCLYFLFCLTLFSGFFVKKTQAFIFDSVDSVAVNEQFLHDNASTLIEKDTVNIPFILTNFTYEFGSVPPVKNDLNDGTIVGRASFFSPDKPDDILATTDIRTTTFDYSSFPGTATTIKSGVKYNVSIVKGFTGNPTSYGLTVLDPGKHYCVKIDIIQEATTYTKETILSSLSSPFCFDTLNSDGTSPTPNVDPTPQNTTTYALLEKLPIGENGASTDTVDITNIGTYLNMLIKLMFALAGAAAVVVIIINGFTMMTSNSPFSLKEAKNALGNAILGLLLMLSAYGILNTINPNLVNLHVGIDLIKTNLGVPGGDGKVGQTGYDGTKKAKNSAGTEVTSGDTTTMVPITLSDFLLSSKPLFTQDIQWSGQMLQPDAKASLIRVLNKYAAKLAVKGDTNNLQPNERISSMWTYGTKDIGSIPSAHHLGIGVDINAPTNPYVSSGNSNFSYTLPQELIDSFKEEGWGWGGDWSGCNCKDPMHFSKLTSEGGSGSDSYTYEKPTK